MNVVQHPALSSVTSLLALCGLPSDDIQPESLAHFFVIEDDLGSTGVVGLQIEGAVGLLRSLGVVERARRRGLGGRLVRRAEQHAREKGVRALYLLTTDASGFFAARGFVAVGRDTAPDAIRGMAQFGSSCCARATFMRKTLDER
jgi:amino-acid N-acetyltransferase